MGTAVFEYCGLFAYPQLTLSLAAVGLWIGYLCAVLRREPGLVERPWRETLEPLAALAMKVGLLGSVVGFVIAFGGFQDTIDVEQLTAGLAKAYWTTAVGIITALVVALGVYTLDILQTRRDAK